MVLVDRRGAGLRPRRELSTADWWALPRKLSPSREYVVGFNGLSGHTGARVERITDWDEANLVIQDGELSTEASLAQRGYLNPKLVRRGGFASVFQAQQASVADRSVAIKVLDRLASTDRERFAAEISVLSQVSQHQNIVSIIDAAADADPPWMAMEFMAGGTLADLIENSGPLPASDVAWAGRRLADAVGAAHNADVVHRDIKPANVLLGNGDLKLADFGIAKLAESTQSTGAGVTATLLYAAPEVLDGEPASVESDLYSLGATLYMLLTGLPPHARAGDDTYRAALVRSMSGSTLDVSALSDVPEDFQSLLSELLSPDPTDRPASASEVSKRLAGIEPATPTNQALVAAIKALPTAFLDTSPASPSPVPRTVARVPKAEQPTTPDQESEYATTLQSPGSRNSRRIGLTLALVAAAALATVGGFVLFGNTDESDALTAIEATTDITVAGAQQERSDASGTTSEGADESTTVVSNADSTTDVGESDASSAAETGSAAGSTRSSTPSPVFSPTASSRPATSVPRSTTPVTNAPTTIKKPTTTSTTATPVKPVAPAPTSAPAVAKSVSLVNTIRETNDFTLVVSTSQCTTVNWSASPGGVGPYSMSPCSTSHSLSPRTNIVLQQGTNYGVSATFKWPDGSTTSESWSVSTTAAEATPLSVSLSQSTSGLTATISMTSTDCTSVTGWFSTTDGGTRGVPDHTGSINDSSCLTSHSASFTMEAGRPYRVNVTFVAADNRAKTKVIDFNAP